jgi:hypothetical protein
VHISGLSYEPLLWVLALMVFARQQLIRNAVFATKPAIRFCWQRSYLSCHHCGHLNNRW